MNKKNAIILVISIVLLGLLIFGGTYAYWSWTSNTNKNVVFNTAKELIEYVEYDDGESTFLGDFKVSSSYNQGIHSTISIKKKDDPDVANVDLVATIKMDINGIGNNMKQSTALKWVVTSGTSSNIIEVLASGNFVGTNAGDVLTLYPNVPVTTTKKDFTVWIWLDASENPSELLTGETLDTVVWTQIDQVEGVQDSFEITRINANYQFISATAVNSKYKIIDYAVTTTDTQPSSWAGNIASANQSNVYTLKHTVSSTGTYYVWFKDSNNDTVKRSVQVTTVDNTAPTCTFGSWNKSSITNNNIATINLTCVDTESGFINSDLQISDFNVIVSNASASLTSINKVSVTNGYQYTLTLKGVSGNGTASIKLYSNKVKNSINLGNSEANSSTISVFNSYTISYNLDGGSHSISCGISTIPVATTYGVDVVICNPTKEGYTFVGWTSSSNDGLESNAKTGTASNPSTTWNGTATTNTYFKNLRTTSGTVTLTATWKSNYQNVDTGIYYKTLADALSAVESNQTIKALNGNGVETSNPTLASGKTGVKFDLNGQTVSVGTYCIDNNGELDIYNSSGTSAILEGAKIESYSGVIYNNGTLTTNGTSSTNTLTIRNISNNANARVIRNGEAGTAILNINTTVTFTQATTTDSRYLISNGGTITIDGANLINNISSSTYDSGILNNSTSSRVIMTSGSINTYGRSIEGAGNGTTVPTISITGGTITSSNADCIFFNSSGTISITGGVVTGGGNGIYMTSSSTGTLIMGIDEGGTPSTTSPVISSTATSGNYYGVCLNNVTNFNFYDGKITSTRGIGYTIHGTVSDTPDGYAVYKSTANGVETAILSVANYQNVDSGRYYITLADALSAVESNQTIKALSGNGVETSNPTLASGKTGVKFDLNGQTVSVGTYYIYNNGELDIYNSSGTSAILEGAKIDGYNGVIYNNGTLTTNGTSSTNILTIRNISNNANARVIRNEIGGVVTLNTNTMVTFTQATTTDSRYLISNGGTITIAGANLINNISSSTYDCGIINNSTSSRVIMTSGSINTYGRSINGAGDGTTIPTISISGGTITSSNGDCIFFNSSGTISITGGVVTGGGNGIYMASSSTGTLIMGIDEGGTPSTTSPVISSTATSGNYYGVYKGSTGTFNFYDGKITSTHGAGYAIDGIPDNIPNDYFVYKTLSGNIETAILSVSYINTNTGVNYKTLSAALLNVANNQTIKVLNGRSETSDATLASSKTGIKLDLNGKTINLGTYRIINNGSLDIYSSVGNGTITGSGASIIHNEGQLTTNATNSSNNISLENTSNSASSRILINQTTKTATLNVNTYLTFTTAVSNNRYLVDNSGILNISGAGLTNTLTSNNAVDYGIINLAAAAKVSMTSGTIDVNGVGIHNQNGTVATAISVSGGFIQSHYDAAIGNDASGDIEVTGGRLISTLISIINNSTGSITISGSSTEISSTRDTCIYNADTGTVTVSGGTLNGTIYGIQNRHNGAITVSGSSTIIRSRNDAGIKGSDGIVTINAGTISSQSQNTSAITIDTGSIRVNGGTMEGQSYGLYSNGAATINVSGRSTNITGNLKDGIRGYTSTITMSGGTVSSTNSTGISTDGGSVTITGGTVNGKKHGVYATNSGIITLGVDDSTVSTNSPIINSTATSGSYYGVYKGSNGTFKFYDGKITSTNGAGYTIYNGADNTPSGYHINQTISNGRFIATLSNFNDGSLSNSVHNPKE